MRSASRHGSAPLLLSVLLLLCFAAPVGAQEVRVIVAEDSPIEDLSEAEVRSLFTGETSFLGARRVRVVLNPGDPRGYGWAARAFGGASVRSFGLGWVRAEFQGAAPAPRLVESEADMVAAILSDPLTIGYVTESSAPIGVRVVAVLPVDGP